MNFLSLRYCGPQLLPLPTVACDDSCCCTGATRPFAVTPGRMSRASDMLLEERSTCGGETRADLCGRGHVRSCVGWDMCGVVWGRTPGQLCGGGHRRRGFAGAKVKPASNHRAEPYPTCIAPLPLSEHMPDDRRGKSPPKSSLHTDSLPITLPSDAEAAGETPNKPPIAYHPALKKPTL